MWFIISVISAIAILAFYRACKTHNRFRRIALFALSGVFFVSGIILLLFQDSIIISLLEKNRPALLEWKSREDTVTFFETNFDNAEIVQWQATDMLRVTHDNMKTQSTSIFYEDGEVTDRYAQLVRDPSDSSNQVLHFWIKNAAIKNIWGYKGRIQVGHTVNTNSFTQTSRMYLHPDMDLYRSYPEKNTWFVVQDFWVGFPKGYPHRMKIGLSIIKPEGIDSALYFAAHAERRIKSDAMGDGLWESVWGEANTDFSVPVGEWIDIRISFEQGFENTGRYVMEIKENGVYKTLFDITDWMYDPESPVSVPVHNIGSLKLYTSDKIINHIRENGGEAQIYWDDLKITNDPPK